MIAAMSTLTVDFNLALSLTLGAPPVHSVHSMSLMYTVAEYEAPQ